MSIVRGAPKRLPKNPSMRAKAGFVNGFLRSYFAGKIKNPEAREAYLKIASKTRLMPIEEFGAAKAGKYVTLGEQRTIYVHTPEGKKIEQTSVLLPKSVITELYSSLEAASRGERKEISNRTAELIGHELGHLRRAALGVGEQEKAYLEDRYSADQKQMKRDLNIIYGPEMAKRYMDYWPTKLIADSVSVVAEEKAADMAAIREGVMKRIMDTGSRITKAEFNKVVEEVLKGRPWPIKRAVMADLRLKGEGKRPQKPKLGLARKFSGRLNEFSKGIFSDRPGSLASLGQGFHGPAGGQSKRRKVA